MLPLAALVAFVPVALAAQTSKFGPAAVSPLSSSTSYTDMMSNVFAFVANATNYTNIALAEADFPLTNLTGVAAGPLNAGVYVPFTAPNMSAVGAGLHGVFVAPSLNTSFTPAACARQPHRRKCDGAGGGDCQCERERGCAGTEW